MAAQASALQNNPPRNTIGGIIDYSNEDQRKSPVIAAVERNDSRRPLPPTMKVQNPETGEIVEHLRFNARDMINIHGWVEYREKAVVDDTPDPTDDMDTGVRADRSENPVLQELDALRDQLRARGVDVDLRKGIKKLRADLELLEEFDKPKSE